MNLRQAMAICHEINSDKYSDEDKAFAVYQVMNMTTHMSVTKEKMKYLNKCEKCDAELIFQLSESEKATVDSLGENLY